VRGGTYFSLPPQREVGKRKRLTPLILKRVPRAATVVAHLESVFSHIPLSWQGSHSSGGAARAVAVLLPVFIDSWVRHDGLCRAQRECNRRTLCEQKSFLSCALWVAKAVL